MPRAPLDSAIGYLELGMYAEAEEELSLLPAPWQARAEVVGLRIEIARTARDWHAMADHSRRLIQNAPDDPAGWIMLAYATRRAHSVTGAEAILHTAAEKFPDEPTILFNLGCYACVRGNQEEARLHVRRAIELDRKFLALARLDPDLVPLQTYFQLDLPDPKTS